MKKSNIASIIIFATLMCVALDSCQNKDDVQKTETEVSVTSFYARSSGSGSPSKTSRQETGSVWWSPNDEITVFCGETSGKFISQNEESADVATFIGSFDSPVSTSDVSSKGVVAFYPYSEDLSCSEGTITFSLPASQPALAGTFDEELYPLIARSNSTELSFYNICGGAKFTVSQEGIKTVTFKGNASEPLAGKLSVTFDENGVPKVEVLEGEKEIVVTAPDGGTFEVDKEYYIVTIPQSLPKGFTIIYNDGLSINNEFKTDKAITIRRAKFGVLKYLDEDLGMINLVDPIEFEDPAVEKICVANWDTDGDGSLSYAEAAAVKSVGTVFKSNTSITSFDEFRYFTGITSIDNKAFYNCTSLTSVTISSSVTSIGSSAFYNCSGLTSVTIPEGVTSIGDYAFYKCNYLTSITIPSSITSIDNLAFYFCESLEDVHISDISAWCNISFASVLSNPLYYAENFYLNGEILTELILPNGIEKIGHYAFYHCDCMINVIIPEDVISIGTYAFAKCNNLNLITILSDLNSIGAYAFADCSTLSDVTIPKGVTSIGAHAFENCTSLADMIFPEGLMTIGDYAFNSCSKLSRVCLPEGITKINFAAFRNCQNLSEVVLPQSITSIGGDAFVYCSNLSKINIPDGIISIDGFAFAYCSGLTNVTIPDNVVSIGYGAFHGSKNIKSIICLPASPPILANAAFTNIDDLIIFIPKESQEEYYTAKGWSDYKDLMVSGIALSQTEVMCDYTEGTFEFGYNVMSSDNNCVLASCENDWISDIIVNNDKISYSISKNTSALTRTGEISVKYSTTTVKYRVIQTGHPVTELSLNKSSITLFANNTEALVPSVFPVDAPLQWSSSDPSIASVDQNGKVTGLNKGVADITVKSLNGNMSATCNVTVLLHVSGVSLDKTFAKVPKGENLALTVTISPSDAYDKNVTWSSSNPSVAIVSDQGVVSARNVGRTTITVLTNDSGKKAECEVIVFIPIEDIILDKTTVELIEGDSVSLVPTLVPTDESYDLIWSSSDTNVAKVSSTGKVAAVKAGTAEIVVKSEYSGESATCIVTVVKRTASGGMEGTEDEDWGI